MLFSHLFAFQDAQIIIELKKKLSVASNKDEKATLFLNLANAYSRQKPDSSIKYALLALDFFNNKPNLKSEILYNIGLNYNFQSNYDKAFYYYKKSLEIREKIKDSIGIGECYYRLGNLSIIRGNFENALDYCYKSIEILKNKNDKIALAYAYNYLGIVLYITGDLKKAEEQMFKTLDNANKIKDSGNIALANEHLAILFIKKNDLKKAKEFVDKSLEIREKLNDNAGLAGSYENLAIINRLLKNYKEAISYYNKSISLKKELNSIRGIASSYLGIGVTYLELGDVNKAIEFMNKSLELRKSLNDKRGIISSYQRLSEAYEKLNDYKKAFEYLKLNKIYSDSLYNERTTRIVTELKEKYDAIEKEKEIEKLNIENEYYKTRINFFILITVLLAGLIVATLLAYNSKRKLFSFTKKQRDDYLFRKNELEELNKQLKEHIEAKEKIYSIIGHDLRSPFQGIMGAVDLLETDFHNLSDLEKLHFIKGIKEVTNNTFRLLENLLEWSKFQTNKINFDPEQINLYLEINKTIKYLEPSANNKKIKIINEIENSIKIFADKNMLTSIVRNLISNAIKFTNAGGIIKIYTKNYESEIEIFVEDNGIGMDKNLIENLFTLNNSITRKGTKNEKGAGLGLLLCKEMVEKHNGKIKVESEVGKGTVFSFTLSKNL